MTIPNFDSLVNTPGVIHKRFCSLCCANEASGEIEMDFSEGNINIPICEDCVDKMEAHVQSLLDRATESVLD